LVPPEPRINAARLAHSRTIGNPRFNSAGKRSKSVKEVAEIIGIAEATVKTRMFYARKKLAALVATA